MTISVTGTDAIPGFKSAMADIGGVRLHYLVGGEKGLGKKVREMVGMIAENVEGVVLADCGHFVPAEQPAEIVHRIQEMAAKVERK